MDLFGRNSEDFRDAASRPLAYRMCPRNLDEYVGQGHILGEGKLLRRAIEADRISSLVLFGPPGTGKTALARVIASGSRGHFEWLNAAVTGIDEIRKAISAAKSRRSKGQRTILFLDEIHRFNKLQQDALLPDVEEGTVVLIAATVENPFFYVNSALISRSHVFELKPLAEEDIVTLLRRALNDEERGLGYLKVSASEDAVSHIARLSDGDARKALSALEVAALTAPADGDGTICLTLPVAEESIQKKAVVYDRQGGQHYDTISAFIKSMRGSDPDAALYYLAKMLYAGEDPRFIARRIIICAAEDIGIADPMALVLATATLKAVEFVGMPEARIPLAEAAVYLARAPKSNACYLAIEAALDDVAKGPTLEVPDHLKNGHYPSAKKLGHGEGYKYPHEFGGHVEQEYLGKKRKFLPEE